MSPLTSGRTLNLPQLHSFTYSNTPRRLLNFAASRAGEPVYFLQTIICDDQQQRQDPQTAIHADSFHPSAKLWLFLHDVGEDEGPFVYVPGSHKLTRKRLQWEYKNSLTARYDSRFHHAQGSFRVRPEELEQLGLPQPKRLSVPANTLIIGDTFGFHGRSKSHKDTVRTEIHGYLRRAPFLPWNGLDIASLPGLRGRQLDIYLGWLGLREKITGQPSVWLSVGSIPINLPPN